MHVSFKFIIAGQWNVLFSYFNILLVCLFRSKSRTWKRNEVDSKLVFFKGDLHTWVWTLSWQHFGTWKLAYNYSVVSAVATGSGIGERYEKRRCLNGLFFYSALCSVLENCCCYWIVFLCVIQSSIVLIWTFSSRDLERCVDL